MRAQKEVKSTVEKVSCLKGYIYCREQNADININVKVILVTIQ